MAKSKKLSKGELEEITAIQSRMQAVKTELGQLALAEIDLKSRKGNIEAYLDETKGLESKLVKSLEEKYGRGSINLQEGEFIPEEVPAKKEVVPTVE